MPEDTPDIYFDGIQFSISPFDVVAQLSQRSPLPTAAGQPPRVVGFVRMSLEYAKVMSMLLKRRSDKPSANGGHKKKPGKKRKP